MFCCGHRTMEQQRLDDPKNLCKTVMWWYGTDDWRTKDSYERHDDVEENCWKCSGNYPDPVRVMHYKFIYIYICTYYKYMPIIQPRLNRLMEYI